MAVQGLGESACCWSTHRALRVNAGEAGGAQDGRSKLVLIRLERIPGVRRGRKTLWILLAHERGGFCGCSHCLGDAVARALMPPADVRKIQTAGLTLHNKVKASCSCSVTVQLYVATALRHSAGIYLATGVGRSHQAKACHVGQAWQCLCNDRVSTGHSQTDVFHGCRQQYREQVYSDEAKDNCSKNNRHRGPLHCTYRRVIVANIACKEAIKLK